MLLKTKPIKSKKLRESARGQHCAIRIPGVCNGDPETVVLCHVGKGSGMGQKASDIFAAFGCSSCHDEIDRRTMIVGKQQAELYAWQGVQETQQHWINEGLLVCK